MTPFLGDLDWTGYGLLLPIIAVTLSLSIPIVAIIVEHFQKKAKMRLVEKAIEHGVDISGLDLDDEDKKGPRLPYRSGMVTTAVGVALIVAVTVAIGRGSDFATVLTVGGAVCLCVGVALLLNDWMNRDRYREQLAARGDVPDRTR